MTLELDQPILPQRGVGHNFLRHCVPHFSTKKKKVLRMTYQWEVSVCIKLSVKLTPQKQENIAEKQLNNNNTCE